MRRQTARRLLIRVCIFIVVPLSAAVPIQTHAAASHRSGETVHLVGAGSTFDAPFFQKAFAAYMAQHPISISYRAVGSGAGIQQFSKGQVDFGASDVPMNDAELQAAQAVVGPVVQAPVVLGGVAIAYNLPGITVPLKLDGPTLAAIFLGTIDRWNDPAIENLNRSFTLPDLAITPIHRAESSGTTYIMTDYLSTVSSSWQASIGKGKSVAWPTGNAFSGSAGVAGAIKQHAGAIGYVELDYAVSNRLAYAEVKNRLGYFVLPTVATVRQAAAQRRYVDPTDFSIVNDAGVQSYPIAGFSWVLLPARQITRGAALLQLTRWLVMDGQKLSTIPLPYDVQEQAVITLASVH